MSLSEFISAENLNNYKNWSAAYEPLVYEQWVPADDYTTLTLQQTFENLTILDSRTYDVAAVDDLKSFYDLINQEEATTLSEVTAETETETTESLPSSAFENDNKPVELSKRKCGSFCGVSIHCLWPPCPKCKSYKRGTWRKKCAARWGN